MSSPPRSRLLVTLLREICAEEGVELTTFSEEWILHLQKGPKRTEVFGYDFALNSATARMIARDKAAMAELLAWHGVPCVEHRLFHSPAGEVSRGRSGQWAEMLAYFEAHHCDLVAKPNEGTGGAGVVRVRSVPALERAVQQLFRQSRALCLSPFGHFTAEYRVAVLQGQAQWIYRKERAALVGDGERTGQELLARWLAAREDFGEWERLGADLAELEPEVLRRRPAPGERVELNWRHNLGQGAAPTLLPPEGAPAREIIRLALRAAESLGIALASVDVVEGPTGLEVLEINSGIMMESFGRVSPECRAVAREFYRRIVRAALG